MGGFIVSRHAAHLDGGYSITDGGFAAMGVQHAALAALSGRVLRRRLKKRAEALAETPHSANIPVDDLSDRLRDLRTDWANHDGLVISDQQFDEELTRISDTFFDRRYPKLPRQHRNRP